MEEIIIGQGAHGRGLPSELLYHQGPRTDGKMTLGKSVPDVSDPGKEIVNMSFSTSDFALHNLAGSTLGIPCYKVFDSKRVGAVPAYDTLIYFDDTNPGRKPGRVARILEECRCGYDYGYRAFKLRISRIPMWTNWVDGLKRDINVARAVREYSPDCKILVNANDTYTMEKMEQCVDGVVDVGLYWVEEPFRENEQDFHTLRKHLGAKSPRTLIADGETDPNIDLLINLYKKGLLGVPQMDIQGDYTLGHAFGLTSWRRVIPEPEEISARISPHAWGLKLKTHHAAQSCTGYPGVTHVKGVTNTTEDADFGGCKLEDSKIYLPEKPGFGMGLIWGIPLTDNDCESKTTCRQA